MLPEPEAKGEAEVEGKKKEAEAEGKEEKKEEAEGKGEGVGEKKEEKKEGEGDDGREVLERRVREVEARFEGVEDIPVPDFWGGLRVLPEVVEFWQGRESRLHDRFRYTRDEGVSGGWKIERLSP